MRSSWAGATGRYQRKCEQGHCALTGGRPSSRREGEVLTLLRYVIGNGRGDVSVRIGGRLCRLDMVFDLPDGRVLAVEYDGAYWHDGRRNIGQEGRDFRKARDVEAAWRDRGCVVVRIREDPLEPLYPLDVQVPARGDPEICAKTVLIHLEHVIHPPFMESLGQDRVIGFLRSAARPLTLGDLRCAGCRDVAGYFLPDQVSRARPSPRLLA